MRFDRCLKLFIIFAACLIASQAIAQVIIEPGDIPNLPGTMMSFYADSSFEGIEVDLGNAGENQQWDFSGFVFDRVETDEILNPENAPHIDELPDANRVIRTSVGLLELGIGDVLQYELLGEDGWFLLGIRGTEDEGFQFPLDFPDNPPMISPMNMEYGQEWQIAQNFSYAIASNPDWGDEFAIIDSIMFVIEFGAFNEIDGSGTARYSGGNVPVLRTHTLSAGTMGVIAITYLLGRRFEVELPLGYELQASHSYRWISPGIGEIASITSLPLEEEPDFNLASSIRVRRMVPALEFPRLSMDFGEVVAGAVGVANFRIANTGTGAGIIDSITFSGEIHAEMEALTEFPHIVEPEASDSIRFLWMPIENRDLSNESMFIYHNDPAFDNPMVIRLIGGVPASVNGDAIQPDGFMLSQNFPNPFNARTSIPFELSKASEVSFRLFDSSGKLVSQSHLGQLPAGGHIFELNALDLESGVYLYQIEAGGMKQARKLMLLK